MNSSTCADPRQEECFTWNCLRRTKDVYALCSTWNAATDSALLQHDKTAANRLDQRIGRLPRQRRMDSFRRIPAARPAEEEDLAARPHECLQRHEDARLHAYGPDRHQVVGFVEIRPRQQFFESC